MRTITKLACTTVAAATLFGLAGMTIVAGAAEPVAVPSSSDVQGFADSTMNVQSTRGFDVTNMSHRTLVLDNVLGSYGWPETWKADLLPDDVYPVKGSVLHPGESMHFEVHAWGNNHGLTAKFHDPAQGGEVRVYLHVSGVSRYSSAIWPFGELVDGGSHVNLLDPAGTTIDLPAGQTQVQADILSRLCGDSDAKCTFTPTNREKVMGATHQIGNTVFNNTLDPQTSHYTVSDAVGTSDSLGGSIAAKGNILGIVETTITATYGHTWTKTHTFTQTEDLALRSHYKGWIEGQEPLIRDTGDFTITMANTTWKLRGVSFDTPDPDGVGAYVKQEAPMTQKEIDTLPKKVLSAP